MSAYDADILLDDLQEDIAARLAADAWFADIAILVLQKGVIESDVESALTTFNESEGGKIGAVVIVMPLAIEVPDDDPHAVRMDLLPIIRVMETPLVNRDTDADGTGKKLYQIALRVIRLFHKWDPGTATRFSVARRVAQPFDAPEGSNGLDINFRARGALDRAAKVLPVLITGTLDAISLSCNTAGATIYYTTDGSLPWVGTEGTPSTATRFGTVLTTLDGELIVSLDGESLEDIAPPFSVDAGTLLRAAAYHPDKQASDAAATQF